MNTNESRPINAKTLLVLLTIGLLPALFAGVSPSKTGVIHLSHEKVASVLEKGGVLLVTNNFKVQTGNRTGPGEVEIHDKDTDIFYILEGSATFVTGGKPVETRLTGPGETRGKEIIGGEEQHLTKGDVIIIPNGVPHWFKSVDGRFLYYVVKVVQ
jgi:glc operon protein GlcG